MSTTAVRKIIKIDEEKCNGCGLCVIPCAEGAIEIVDGKAKVMTEELCDGAGFCLGVCPEGALTIEEREAPVFDEAMAEGKMRAKVDERLKQHCFRCGNSEDDAVLFPARWQGQSLWACARCLPPLIHG